MAGSWSWHARFSVLTYLQIMVFYNLFTLLSVPGEVLRVRVLVLQLLLDEQLEVPSDRPHCSFTIEQRDPPLVSPQQHSPVLPLLG